MVQGFNWAAPSWLFHCGALLNEMMLFTSSKSSETYSSQFQFSHIRCSWRIGMNGPVGDNKVKNRRREFEHVEAFLETRKRSRGSVGKAYLGSHRPTRQVLRT